MEDKIQIELRPNFNNHTWDIFLIRDGISLEYTWHSEAKPNLSEVFAYLMTMGVK